MTAKFHADMFARYIGRWTNPGDDAAGAEAAYAALEHASRLDRTRGDDRCRRALGALDPAERRRLAAAACRVIAAIDLDEQVRHLYRHEALEVEHVEYAASLLVRRDALDGVLTMLAAVCGDLVRGDVAVSRMLAEAACRAADVDEVFLSRPDIVAAAAPLLNGLKATIRNAVDRDRPWWFATAAADDVERTWDRLSRACSSPPPSSVLPSVP